jgi:glutathione reductase (NADPH)
VTDPERRHGFDEAIAEYQRRNSVPRYERQGRGSHVSESKAYDLAVIGTGTAAQVASFRVRAAGWSVAVIDHLPFGGTCALRGCDPKKMLISGAEAIDMARRMRGRGVTGELGISWRELVAFKRTFTDPVPQKQEHRLAERGIDAFHGKARFTGPTSSCSA